MESGYGSQPNQSQANNNNAAHHRDLETEELIEDQVSSEHPCVEGAEGGEPVGKE